MGADDEDLIAKTALSSLIARSTVGHLVNCNMDNNLICCASLELGDFGLVKYVSTIDNWVIITQ